MRCPLTVVSARYSRPAISSFVSPATTSARIWRSRNDSAGRSTPWRMLRGTETWPSQTERTTSASVSAHRLLDDDPRDARVEEVADAARRVLVDEQHDVRVGEAAADAVDLGRRAADGDAGEDDDVRQSGEALDDQAAVAAELDVRRHPVAPQRGTDAVDQARVVGHDRDRDDRGARTAPAGERDHAGHDVADAARSAHATAFGVNVAGRRLGVREARLHRDPAAVVQRVDRALAALHPVGDLPRAQAHELAQHDHLALVVGQLRERLAHGADPQRAASSPPSPCSAGPEAYAGEQTGRRRRSSSIARFRATRSSHAQKSADRSS